MNQQEPIVYTEVEPHLSKTEPHSLPDDDPLAKPADRFEQLRKDAQNGKLVLVIGTGFTMGLAEYQKNISWDGLLTSLWKYKGLNVSDQQNQDLDFLLAGVEDVRSGKKSRELYTAQLLAAGYMIKELHDTQDTWDPAVSEIFEKMAVKPDSVYLKVLKAIKDLACPPLIFTTNYDDLIADSLDWKVLYQLPKRDAMGKWVSDGHLEYGIPGKKKRGGMERRPSYMARFTEAGQFLHATENRWLRPEDRFVFHLHGWWGDPGSLVLDPADYERYSEASIDRMLGKHYLLNPGSSVLFLGMGDGMVDPHLRRFWMADEGMKPLKNYWVLDPGEIAGKLENCSRSNINMDNKTTVVSCRVALEKGKSGKTEVEQLLEWLFL